MEEFDDVVAEMPRLLQKLSESVLLSRDDLSGVSLRGVYVLYEEDRPIYVGRSNRLKNRLLEHSRPRDVAEKPKIAEMLTFARHDLEDKTGRKGVFGRSSSSTHNSAPFAFNLAKEQAVKKNIDTSRSRDQLEKDTGFNSIFIQAKKRVYQMNIRTVQIDKPVLQTIFEVYAALALKTPYNDFNTH